MTLQEYFKEYQQSFWNWRDQTEVIALSDGSTLVYKAYLISVLEGLALADTPPLDSLLLALAATKPEGKQAIATAQKDIMQLLYGGVEDYLEVPKGFDFLAVLQQLPASYHQGKERLFLLQTIFTNCYQAYDKDLMQEIISDYKKLSSSSFEQLVSDDGRPVQPNTLFRALFVLEQLAERFPTLEDLTQALEAKQQLEAPILEEPTEVVEEAWREQLVKEVSTFYMASLFPALQAGLSLPSLQRLQQQEAFGGTADLSNKGDFDRLLISEFAYDKTLFLSRLVNKEALYRQREASPERPTLTRHLLIDTSIYNWGSIKQIAFGLALSLEQAGEDSIQSLIYSIGQQADLLAWDSVDQVAKELNRIDPCLNAAEGLTAFFKKHRPNSHQEVVLISSKEAVEQTAMRQVMRQYQAQLHYWIAPTAQGKISAYQYHTGRKLLQEFQLSLSDAWHPNKLPNKKASSRDPRLQAVDTPILVPEPRQYEQLLWAVTDHNTELFMLAAHGHLLRAYGVEFDTLSKRPHGWEWLYGGLLDYTLAEVGYHTSGDFMLLVGMRSPSRLDLVNLTTKKQVQITLPEQKGWYLEHFTYHEDTFYALDNKKAAWKVAIQEQPILESFEEAIMVRSYIDKHLLFVQKQGSKARHTKHYQILKNINTISITERGHLLINGRHQLQLTTNGIIKISDRTSPTILSAQQDYKKKRLRNFSFPDGSTVTANSLGLMTLTSSNKSLPPIYLPMVLNKSLGMATGRHFCGNPYYYKNLAPNEIELVTPEFFINMYLKPFIDTIVNGGILV